MRLRRRPQGRIPLKLRPTVWTVLITQPGDFDGPPSKWTGEGIVGLHHWLLDVKPEPLAEVTMIRNGKTIYHGSWQNLADEQTLW